MTAKHGQKVKIESFKRRGAQPIVRDSDHARGSAPTRFTVLRCNGRASSFERCHSGAMKRSSYGGNDCFMCSDDATCRRARQRETETRPRDVRVGASFGTQRPSSPCRRIRLNAVGVSSRRENPPRARNESVSYTARLVQGTSLGCREDPGTSGGHRDVPRTSECRDERRRDVATPFRHFRRAWRCIRVSTRVDRSVPFSRTSRDSVRSLSLSFRYGGSRINYLDQCAARLVKMNEPNM